MKGLVCPCPALPHFWQLGAHFMAEGSRTQAPREGPPVSIQFLRAQYEGLRRQQRTQAHLLVLPKGGSIPTPAESVVTTVWINKERRSSPPPEEADPGVQGTLEGADRNCLQAPESPWHTHLEMHRLVQTFHQKDSHQVNLEGQLVGLPPEGDPHSLENNQKTLRGTNNPEATQQQHQGINTKTKDVGSSLKNSIQCLPSMKNPHRSGKAAHYPFPQRKTPRISQAARNLGLYGST
nr:uncharacterized protein C9orf152 homolog [Castor canadensis]